MTAPRPDNGHTQQQGRYTVHEAALLLGLSVEAVRKRAERGKLTSVKGEDGTRYILLDADHQAKTGLGQDNAQTELVEALYGQIEFLREELASRNVELRHREEEYREESRRKDHLLAAALERIPELPAPAAASEEAPEVPEMVAEGAKKGTAPPTSREPSEGRSWFYRFFFES
jgi:hypothetical protein